MEDQELLRGQTSSASKKLQEEDIAPQLKTSGPLNNTGGWVQTQGLGYTTGEWVQTQKGGCGENRRFSNALRESPEPVWPWTPPYACVSVIS